jgi:hypothetical protein
MVDNNFAGGMSVLAFLGLVICLCACRSVLNPKWWCDTRCCRWLWPPSSTCPSLCPTPTPLQVVASTPPTATHTPPHPHTRTCRGHTVTTSVSAVWMYVNGGASSGAIWERGLPPPLPLSTPTDFRTPRLASRPGHVSVQRLTGNGSAKRPSGSPPASGVAAPATTATRRTRNGRQRPSWNGRRFLRRRNGRGSWLTMCRWVAAHPWASQTNEEQQLFLAIWCRRMLAVLGAGYRPLLHCAGHCAGVRVSGWVGGGGGHRRITVILGGLHMCRNGVLFGDGGGGRRDRWR